MSTATVKSGSTKPAQVVTGSPCPDCAEFLRLKEKLRRTAPGANVGDILIGVRYIEEVDINWRFVPPTVPFSEIKTTILEENRCKVQGCDCEARVMVVLVDDKLRTITALTDGLMINIALFNKNEGALKRFP